jgi:membrane protein YqaA with SNARE-associated domain
MFLLFVTSFLAATVLPFGSEVHFAFVLKNNDVTTALLVATTGNTLGGMFSYWIGWLARWMWIETYFRVKKEKILKFKSILQKAGGWLGFFCWMPLIGDVISIGLGVFRVKPILTFSTMLIGKFIRYLIIALFFME